MALQAQNFLAPIDLNHNELRNAVVQNVATLPSAGSSVTGQIVYKTGTGAGEYYFDGAAWQLLSAGAGASNATTSSPGLVQLAGDLGLSATAPTVVGARGAIAAAAAATGFTVAPTLTTQTGEAETGTSLGLVLTLAATTGNTVTLVTVPTHTGTATAGATITAFTALNIAAQTGVTNAAYSGNAYGLVANAPGLTGPTNYAARFVGNTQFTGTVDVTGQAVIAATIGPAAGQQHSVPAVTSDVIVLVGATQTLTAKTLTAPVLGGTVTGTYTLGGTPSLAATALTGTLAAAQFPAHTGDVTTVAGSLATTAVGASGTFYIGGSGNAKLKSASASLLQVRNNADSAFGDLSAQNITVNGSLTVVGDLVQSTGTIVKSTDVFALLNDGAASFAANPASLAYATGQFTAGAGLIVERYNVSTTRQDAGMAWDESVTAWKHTVISGTNTQQLRVASVFAVDCAAATTTTVSHNLNTTDVHVTVYDKTNKNIVFTDCQVTDGNNVAVNFSVAPTAGQYRIVIIG